MAYTDQTLILVDNKGRFLGYDAKKVCHTGRGKHHRAIIIAIYNSKGEILLQKRRHEIFDAIWDLSGATHPLHLHNKNESYSEAAMRCARDEWGISKVNFRKVGAFNYFKKDGRKCENEYCAIMLARYSGRIKRNPKVAYGFTWMPLNEVKGDAKRNPEKYTMWALKALPKLTSSSLRR